MRGWAKAQRRFETAFGVRRSSNMRALLHAVAATGL
jgi:hypothetical protein